MDIFDELEKERKRLEEMATKRLKQGLPLTDEEVMEQSSKVDKLIEMTLKETE